MKIRTFLLAGAVITAITGGTALYGAAALAQEPDIVLAQNDEQEGFLGRIFNRSDKNTTAKPLFLDRRGTSPGGQGKAYDYSNQGAAGRGRTKSFTDEDGLKIMMERDAAVMNRTDEILRVAALENERRSAALEKSILESSAPAADKKDGEVRKKLVYDPKNARVYNPNKSPLIVTRPSSEDEEGQSGTSPGGRIYNAR